MTRRVRWFLHALVGCTLALAPASLAEGPAQTSTVIPSVAGCDVLPVDSIWNTPVDGLPLDGRSAAYVATIGASRTMHADFGSGLWAGGPIGIPFVTVPGSQPRVAVTFEYGDESDPGPYPIPANPPIEGGPNSTGDRHILIVDRDNCRLWELYAAYPQPDGSWSAGSGAIYDLRSNSLRPAGWTSADAAGLPILPGLVRYNEVAGGEITHAIRFTAPQTRRAYVWPARHYASDLTGLQYPPMGQRFRLKASYNISGFAPEVQVILRALKKYGMILADNGSPWFISGAPDERWDNDVLHQLHSVPGSAFEAVDVSSLMVNPDSAQARVSPAIALAPGWNLVSLPVTPSSPAITQALASIAGRYDQVAAYVASDAADPWKTYRPAAPPYVNSLLQLTEQMGMWIRVTSAATLTVAGASPLAGAIALRTGWNMVGYPSLVTRPLTEALASIAGRFDLVYAYVASDAADPWKRYNASVQPVLNDLVAMEPGRGYWIRATTDCTWIVPRP